MIETKAGIIYEPAFQENRWMYEWLKKHYATLGGSRAYEEMKEGYEYSEFILSEQNKRHAG
ncbi:hypothetical protein [Mesobacillus zeae]|uniref:hypothetical protein n=1 Tax=Mesobacillus zeae TaxID=1917180 RepID=UPI00115ED52E|nr:hypothetical protein [Mesobacillus zeae]